MANLHSTAIHELEKLIDYPFTHKKTLLTALTHSSFAHEKKHKHIEDNERLEFLGDAILKLVVSDYLFSNFKHYAEGTMTKIRAVLISDKTLASIATEINLGKLLLLSRNEKKTGGETRASILANALEAIIGAIYIDGGLSKSQEVIHRLFQHLFSAIEPSLVIHDYKSKLQEIMQQKSDSLPEYTILKEVGPDHDKTFIIEGKVVVDEVAIHAVAHGKTKKITEQNVARKILNKLNAV